jgi:alkanesulfonate monooxygenase SsuD/methylene tetrahydromethanopterin reductase-like flavin-dependent oxidoreductase (luciferase family)
MLFGSPEEVADGVRAFADTLGGRGLFGFRTPFPGLDPSVQREAFDTRVEEVVPLLR